MYYNTILKREKYYFLFPTSAVFREISRLQCKTILGKHISLFKFHWDISTYKKRTNMNLTCENLNLRSPLDGILNKERIKERKVIRYSLVKKTAPLSSHWLKNQKSSTKFQNKFKQFLTCFLMFNFRIVYD